MTQVENRPWTPLCQQTDLIPHSGIAAKLGEQQVALFYLPDYAEEVFALANLDPFSNANVLARGLVGDLQGEPMIASPLYKQRFSLATGICLDDETVQISRWPARLTGGVVEIQYAGH